jgi:hypothetical protein
MTADSTELVALARTMLDHPNPVLEGRWPRAVALIARQAMEMAMAELWDNRAPGLRDCSARAQLLCISELTHDPAVARRASWTWWALSRTCHQHPYDLSPTASELTSLIEDVHAVVVGLRAARRSEAAHPGGT